MAESCKVSQGGDLRCECGFLKSFERDAILYCSKPFFCELKPIPHDVLVVNADRNEDIDVIRALSKEIPRLGSKRGGQGIQVNRLPQKGYKSRGPRAGT